MRSTEPLPRCRRRCWSQSAIRPGKCRSHRRPSLHATSPWPKPRRSASSEYTNAVAASRQAAAQVAHNKAQLETAKINLKFTTVPAPTGPHRAVARYAGCAGHRQSGRTAGAHQPALSDLHRHPQPAAALLALRRSLAQDGVVPASAQMRLMLQDGSDYGQIGKVEFSEVLVHPSTDTVTVRARFANPHGVLLPAMSSPARASPNPSTSPSSWCRSPRRGATEGCSDDLRRRSRGQSGVAQHHRGPHLGSKLDRHGGFEAR